MPSDILIALDEAYVEYIRDGMLPDSFGWSATTAMSLCCARFRRPTGWPGLRVGYAVGDPDIITALGKVYVPFTATSISQAAAIASLDASDELLARTDAVVAERARVTAALRDAGFHLPPSQANFVWLPLGTAPRTSSSRPPTHASWSAPMAPTGCASPSARRRRTTPCWLRPGLDLGSEP